METAVDIGLSSEALGLYLSEVKNSHQEIEFEEDEHLVLNGIVQFVEYVCYTN